VGGSPNIKDRPYLLEASIQLASELALVGAARRFVDQAVADWGLDPIRNEARLITSELSANAVLHARTDFGVTLRSDGLDYLRIEVRDENSRMPSSGAPRQDALSGRGLLIVDGLATCWGTELDGGGKMVWAEIGRRALSRTDKGSGVRDFAR
jgi:anti-sigma regulatory factor (Ser/Thr protein kinase)